jgi:hypothetical protein
MEDAVRSSPALIPLNPRLDIIRSMTSLEDLLKKEDKTLADWKSILHTVKSGNLRRPDVVLEAGFTLLQRYPRELGIECMSDLCEP